MSLLTLERRANLAIVTVDRPPVNALSHAVREALLNAVETLEADASVEAVILRCAGPTFIAGADVSEFSKPPAPPHLPDLVAKIESAGKPWVAALHGSALGGGLEIAMGCRFRIATETASLGLPEVTLGLVPGAGGTVRTPRLIGIAEAIDLVTRGKPIRAPRAFELGLIDALAGDDLLGDAVDFIREALAKPLPLKLSERPIDTMPDEEWRKLDADIAKRAKGEIAPLRALACLRKAAESDFATAMGFERQTFLELRASDQAAALRAVFFAERAAIRPARYKDVQPKTLQSVAVIGGGTMGAGIAAALCDAGLPVALLERDEEALTHGIAKIQNIFADGVKRGKRTEASAAEAMAGIVGATRYDALKDVDLVIEAVFEEIDVKRDVFKRLDAVCRKDAILATNTSYLDPKLIVKELSNPSRFLGLHFFSPANIMRLLEIIPTPETSKETLAASFVLARRLGKIPVEAGICEGFIGNRILMRYRFAAERLLRQGVAISDVDAAMRQFGFAMGPFEAQDLGGLDIGFLQREGARALGRNIPEHLADILVRAGRKGVKTSGGWYDYRAGDREPKVSPTAQTLLAAHIHGSLDLPLEQIADRLVSEMAAEGEAVLAEGIAREASDIDLVEIHGYGFPRWRGGPMFSSRPSQMLLGT